MRQHDPLPNAQVAPDGDGHRSNGGIKVEVGVGVQEVAEDTGEGMLKQATSPLLHKLPALAD